MIRLAPGLALPLELVTESVAILAVKRAGKSHTAKRLTEELHRAGQQVVVIDPKGDWWGLRSSADGRAPGLPVVILGGEHGDVPLEPGAGELVGKLIVEQRVSLVVDLSELRKHQVATFMTALLETLYRLKAKDEFRTPMMLVVDEADAIAPQRPMKGEERMLGAAEDIVRRGGQRGIGITLVSQRAAVLNKNVLTQCGVLILLRTTGSQDIDAVDEWIKKHGQQAAREKVMATLAQLPRGTAWVWAPGWPTEAGIFRQVEVGPLVTFDSGATPKPGQRQARPKTVADVDLEAFRREMAATIERAKADDPRALRAELAELRRRLAAKPAPPAAPAPKRIEVPALSEPALRRLEAFAGRLVAFGDQVVAVSRDITAALAKVQHGNGHRAPSSAPSAPRRSYPAPARPVSPRRRDQDDGAIGGVTQRILDALAELEAIGSAEPDRELVAILAGYTNLTSKGFANGIGAARSAGLVDYLSGGRITLTEPGRAAARPADAPRSSAEIQERIFRLLGGASEKILRPLVDAYPRPLEKTAVAEAAGYTNLTSKGFANAIGRLRSLGFVDYPGPGLVAARPVLFLRGD